MTKVFNKLFWIMEFKANLILTIVVVLILLITIYIVCKEIKK